MSNQHSVEGGARRPEGSSGSAVLRRHMVAIAVAVIFVTGFESLTLPLIWSVAQLHWIPVIVAKFVMLGLGVFGVWLTIWSHARALHVERLLARGLEIDEPTVSLSAQRRDLRGLAF